MWPVVVTLIIIAASCIVDKYILRTIRRMKAYHKAFTDAGYKFKYDDFVLFGGKMYEYLSVGQKQYGNPNHYFQSVMPQFDGAISSMMNKPVIHISNPDLLQEYFNGKEIHYVKFERILQNVKRVIGSGVAFSQGQSWKKKRKIISTAFHFNFLHSLIPNIVSTVNRIFDDFEQVRKEDNSLSIDVLEQFQKVFSQIMVRLFFGCDTSNQRLEQQQPSLFFVNLVNDITQQSFQPIALVLGSSFLKLGLRKKDRDINRKVKVFNQFARKLVTDKVQELKDSNFKEGDKRHGNLIEQLYLSKSISFQDKGSVNQYDFKELIEEFCTFVVAGTDTTSALSTMMVIFLSKLPKVQELILEQLDTHVKTDDDWTPQNIKKLVFMEACIKQTMRMFGPGTMLFAREAESDHTFKDIPIKKGTLLNVQFHSNHYNPKYFNDPWKFRPERWLNENQTFPHPFIFVPFSGGRRNCIGQHLSNIQIKILIGKFLRRYSYNIDEVIKLKFKFLVCPDNFHATLQKRKRP